MEALLRWRDRAALALVAVVLARPLVLGAALWAGDLGLDEPRTAALTYDPAAALALAAVAVWCTQGKAARRRLITALAAAAVAVSVGFAGVVTGLVLPALSWPDIALYVIAGLAELVALVLLLAAWAASRAPAPVAALDESDEGEAELGAGHQEGPTPSIGARATTLDAAPVWEATEASGAVWLSAEAAASGAAGITGTSDDGGWGAPPHEGDMAPRHEGERTPRQEGERAPGHEGERAPFRDRSRTPIHDSGRELPPRPDTPNRPA
jgi:hypothetical protein